MIKARKAVIKMQEYKPPISGRRNCIKLDFNENIAGCSTQVIRIIRKIKPSDLAAYPEYGKLGECLANYCNVKADEIAPTNGTDEAIKTIFETYIEKTKDEIIIPVPTYAMYKFYAQLNEAVIKEIKYNKDLTFSAKRVLKAINSKTKIIILANPNNPTGTSINKKDVTKIIKKARRNNAIVLIDEAYCQFSGKTSVPLIKKYDNLLITQTFSKAFGLAGVRLGYIISNKSNIRIIKKVLSPYSVNIVAAICASAALGDLNYIKKYTVETKKSKSLLYKELNDLGVKFYKSDANFILLRIGSKSIEFCKRLREMGILIRDRSGDPLLKGCVRVTLGTITQTKKLIPLLRQTVKEIKPLLILDIDGVLAGVSKSYRVALKSTSDYFTKENITFEEIQDYKNKGGFNNDWDLAEAIIKSRGKLVDKKMIIKKFQNYYKRLASDEKWLLNKKILKKLSKKYNLAILTGRPRKEAGYVLRKNKVNHYFRAIVSMEDVSQQKPSPEGILKILKQCSNSEAYYLGDTIDDMKAAVAANINPIGVLPPQDKSSELRKLLIKNNAKYVINNINRIFEVLT